MRGVLLEVPESLLAERRQRGIDRWDEMWEGVLHLVPQPSRWHQAFGTKLVVALTPGAEALGLEVSYETSLFRTDDDYRVPDIAFASPSHGTERGLRGAELLIEILSAHDESYEKLPFYAALGVREVLIANPDSRAFELYALRGKQYVLVSPDEKGVVRSQVLGVALSTIEGPKLRIGRTDGVAEI